MTEAELLRRLRLGEDSSLELKSVQVEGNKVRGPGRDDLADELAAMANGRGGTLVLGVADRSREIVGIPLECLDTVETLVREVCNDSLNPALPADIFKIELPDAQDRLVPLIRIDIPSSLFIHESPNGYFRRIGSSKRKMQPEMLARLFQERSQSRVIRFDESPTPGTQPDALDYARIRRFLAGEVNEESSRKLRLIVDDADGAARISLAGVLMCTAAPQRWLPHAEIQAVGYAGERHDIDYQMDARDIGGTLDEQVTEALHFVRRNMLVRATKQQERTDRPQFSERAVFEALVNAVAHRDYSMAGSRIRLHLFGDRLELYVPGALANTLTPDSLHLRQSSRNELIVSLLGRCGAPSGVGRTHMMDRRGDGVPVILEESEKLSARLPEYTLIDDSELRLIIWAA